MREPAQPDAVSTRTVATNGVDLFVAEAGDPEAPPVILCHGFPELGYSWRHQLPALAAAGYHAIAPDQRGYGRSSRPTDVGAYDIVHLTDDLLGLLDAQRRERAVFVGHDWGAIVVWALALRAPERMAGVVGMSVPFMPRNAKRPPTESMRFLFEDRFFYILYFQEPGVADADLGADPATTMRRMFGGLNVTGSEAAAWDAFGESTMTSADDGRGLVERMPEPGGLPAWLSREELDHYVAEFTRTGFTGAINWYRNFDRNWHLMEGTQDATVTVPARLIGGSGDPVLRLTPPETQDGWLDDDRGTVIVEGAGHWVQQERPDEVNAALLDFLAGLDRW